MASVADITARILARCAELGFARAGISDAASPTEYAQELEAWISAGKHGEMTYLADRVDILIDPQKLLPGARSIICVADRYAGHSGAAGSTRTIGAISNQIQKKHAHVAPHNIEGMAPPPTCSPIEGAIGRVARYALGLDYHKVIRKRLHELRDALQREYPKEQFRVCVDTAPLLERSYAQRAGIGSVGKHTLIIEEGVGSWLLLGEIVTTMELKASDVAETEACGSCTRCIDACPTQAITPWSVDATRCISYLTIEHRSEIDPKFHEAMGEWIYGCDVCQEVCPHNQPTRRTVAAPRNEAYRARPELASGGFDLLEVLNWTEDDRRRAFERSALKRARLTMIKRNALIVAGNILKKRDDAELRARIEAIANDQQEDEVVKRTARVVMGRFRTAEDEQVGGVQPTN